MVCPPLTGRYATSDWARLFCATSVAPAAGVTTFAKSLLSMVTPAISGCPALKVPSENALNCEVRRVVVRIVVAACPSAVDSVRLPRPIVAKAVLDDYASSVHVVGQVVTQRILVEEREIANGTTIWYCWS